MGMELPRRSGLVEPKWEPALDTTLEYGCNMDTITHLKRHRAGGAHISSNSNSLQYLVIVISGAKNRHKMGVCIFSYAS